MKYIYSQHEAVVLNGDELGGKAANLSWLSQNGFSVPQWWVVSSTISEFYILQTRPVTRLPYQSVHHQQKIIFDNSNIQESYCGVTTPLTFSFVRIGYATVYEQTMRALGYPASRINQHRNMLDNLLGMIRGRIYYNINNWYKGLQLLPFFQTNKEDMERMMGLEDPVDFVEDHSLTLWEKLQKVPQMTRAVCYLFYSFRTMDKRVEKFLLNYHKIANTVNARTLISCNGNQLIEKIKYLDTCLLHRWTTPILNDFYVMMYNGRVARTLSAAKIENSSALLGDLLSGDSDIESVQPTKVLLKMCDYARNHPELYKLLREYSDAVVMRKIQQLHPDFHQQCVDFIEKYGDRTMGELKLETITMKQDAGLLYRLLTNYLSTDDLSLETFNIREKSLKNQAEKKAFAQIHHQLGARRLRRFKKQLTRLRQAIRHRENMRFTRTRMFGLYRELFLRLGQQYFLEGILAEPRDIFYLTLEEIYSGYDGTTVQTQLKPLITTRKQEFAAWENEAEPAHHLFIRGSLYQQQDYSYPYKIADNSGNSYLLQGIGCYPGIVEKQVRLIKSAQSEMSLAGKILCTVRTDPGWAPLFPTVGGLVIERGSTLSHSAVIARELGIPAIVGVPHVTEILQDNEMIQINGATGSVVRLEAQVAGEKHDNYPG